MCPFRCPLLYSPLLLSCMLASDKEKVKHLCNFSSYLFPPGWKHESLDYSSAPYPASFLASCIFLCSMPPLFRAFFNLCEVLFTLSLIGKGVPSVRCSPSPWKNVQAYTNITLFRIQKFLVWQNLVLFQDSKYVLTKFKCKITNNQY